MKIISVVNQKGGSGKTTTTTLIALTLVSQGKKVLCIDSDPQGGLTAFLTGQEPQTKNGLFDYVIGENPKPLEIKRNGFTFDLLHADYRLDKVFSNIDVYTFEEIKKDYSEYDFIIFDTPPTIQGITRATAHISDKIIIPADISRGTIAPTLYTIESLKQIKKTGSVFLIGYKETDKGGFMNNLSREFKNKLGKNYCGSIPKGVAMQKTATDHNLKWNTKRIESMKEIFGGIL